MKKLLLFGKFIKLLFTLLIFFAANSPAMQSAFETAYWAFLVKIKPHRPEDYIHREIALKFKNQFIGSFVCGDKLLVCLNEKLTKEQVIEQLKTKRWFHEECLGKEQEIQLPARSETQGAVPFLIGVNGRIHFVSKSEVDPACRKSQSLIVRR